MAKAKEDWIRVDRAFLLLDLTRAEKISFFTLISFIGWENNIIEKTITVLAEHSKQDTDTMSKSISSLISKGVLKKEPINKIRYKIHINPEYVWCGDRGERNRAIKAYDNIL